MVKKNLQRKQNQCFGTVTKDAMIILDKIAKKQRWGGGGGGGVVYKKPFYKKTTGPIAKWFSG